MTATAAVHGEVETPSFREKTVLVLGASKGIGAEAARAFGRHGATVILAARTESALHEVAQEIEQVGGKTLVRRVDLGDSASVKAMGSWLRDDVGGLDCAFNNAGEGLQPTPLADVPDDAFERVLRVTVQGTFLALKEEIPLVVSKGGGAIVNMSSTAGVSGFSGGGPYMAAKHAIIGLTKSAALDYAQQGIRVNAVAPGPIDTYRMKAAPEPYRQQARQAVPMRRLGLPEDVADVVLWLCSDQSKFVTGSTVFIDGGRMAGFA
ncbi:MAG: SDR family NAD(P)-dependent oxidoreductase [Thermoplasmata archaeon]